MKKFLIVISLLFAIADMSFGQDTPGNCQLADSVKVDGMADEWPMSWLKDDDKIFSYNVCADDNNIYIRMKTNDEVTRRKIAYFGLTVWIDPNGKKKRRLGLKFPSGVEAKERMDKVKATEDQRKHFTSVEIQKFQKELNVSMIQDLEVLELLGLSDDPITSTRTGITNGLKVAIAAEDDGTYVYEAVIPFKSYRLSKASIKQLNIGFETGKFVPPPQKNTGGNMSSGGMSNGMAARQGMPNQNNGGRAGGNYYYRGPQSPYMSATSAWVETKLK